MQRIFLLHPRGVETPPQGEVRKIGWIPGAKPMTRVLLQGEDGMLIVGEPGREVAEQPISAIAARALLGAAGKHQVAVAEADAGEWQVRQYEGAHWGVVTGVIETRRLEDPIPPMPAEWRIGREITGTDGADESRLALMPPLVLAEYQTIR